jgi:hypothetical protein
MSAPKSPRELAQRMRSRKLGQDDDGFVREIETWRELPGGEIEFTMKRLRSAD